MPDQSSSPDRPDVADQPEVADQPGAPGRPNFYDAIGGGPALRRLVDAFYDQVLQDPLLAPVFAHFTPTHVDHVVVWLSEVFGGPAEYSARLGGHDALLHHHLGLSITEEQRARWAELMLSTAAKELPQDELLHQRFAEYVEWGTGIAKSVSQPGVELGEPGPAPRWGWQGLA